MCLSCNAPVRPHPSPPPGTPYTSSLHSMPSPFLKKVCNWLNVMRLPETLTDPAALSLFRCSHPPAPLSFFLPLFYNVPEPWAARWDVQIRTEHVGDGYSQLLATHESQRDHQLQRETSLARVEGSTNLGNEFPGTVALSWKVKSSDPSSPSTSVPNLWVVIPLGVEWPFHGG